MEDLEEWARAREDMSEGSWETLTRIYENAYTTLLVAMLPGIGYCEDCCEYGHTYEEHDNPEFS